MSREEAPAAQSNVPAIPKPEELDKEVAPVVALAKEIIIDSDMMYEEAADELKAIKSKKDTLEQRRKAITQPLDAAKKSVMDLFRTPLTSLEEAEGIFKGKMLTYFNEQEKIRREAAIKAEAAANAERDKLAQQAEEARQSGDETTALVLENTAECMTAPAVTAAAPKASGIGTTTRWSAEVEDKMAFIRFCLTPEGEQYLDAVAIDMRPLNQLAIALKDKMKIPGIKAVPTTGMSVRR